MNTRVGQTFIGQNQIYKIVKELNLKGGMGDIYMAKDQHQKML